MRECQECLGTAGCSLAAASLPMLPGTKLLCELEPGVVFDLVCMAVDPDGYLPAIFSRQPILKGA